MKIKFVIEEDDIAKEVCLTASPVEYLVISSALKQFVENPNNHSADVKVAQIMREEIENHGNND